MSDSAALSQVVTQLCLTDISTLPLFAVPLHPPPILRPAEIVSYEKRMWGQYPALLTKADVEVVGSVYHVKTVEEGEKLACYETCNYGAEPCLIEYLDRLNPHDSHGHTFLFADDEADLRDGNFDLNS